MFVSFLWELGYREWGPLLTIPFALIQGWIFRRTTSLTYVVAVHLLFDALRVHGAGARARPEHVRHLRHRARVVGWSGDADQLGRQLHLPRGGRAPPADRGGAAGAGRGRPADPRAGHPALLQRPRRRPRRAGRPGRPGRGPGDRRATRAPSPSPAAPATARSRSTCTRPAGRCTTWRRCRTSRSPARSPPPRTARATGRGTSRPRSPPSSSSAPTARCARSGAATTTSPARSSRSARSASSPA